MELKTDDCSVNRYEGTKTFGRPNIALNRSGSMTALVNRNPPNNYNGTHPRFCLQNNAPKVSEISSVSKENSFSALKGVSPVSRSIPRSEISIKQWNGKNRLENVKNMTNMHLTINKSPSPQHLERQTPLNDPMVIIPRMQLKSNAANKSMTCGYDICVAKPKEQLIVDNNESLLPKPVFERRKTVAGNLAALKSVPYNLRHVADTVGAAGQTFGAMRVTRRRNSRLKSSYASIQSSSISHSHELPLNGKSAVALHNALQAVERDRNRPNKQPHTR